MNEDPDLATDDIPLFDIEEEEEEENELKPNLGEYWKIKNGAHFLFAKISSEVPLEVKYFTPSVKGGSHYLSETPYAVCTEDLQEKIDPPIIISKGRKRKFYQF